MRHVGNSPQWVNISGNVIFPDELAQTYQSIMQTFVDSFETDFAHNIHLGNFMITPMVVQPRGLVNSGLMCFANASIQLLFASPPFVSFANFMKSNFPLFSPRQRNITPTWRALCSFLNNFKFTDCANTDGAFTSIKSLNMIELTSPTNTSIMNEAFGRFSSKRHPKQQEDASEFLSFFLNKLHDELLELIALSPLPPSENDIGGWSAKSAGKIVPIVDTQGKLSPISTIFGSFVRAETFSNGKSRSLNAEINLVLQIPIVEAKSIEQAIHQYLVEEYITDEISKKNTFTGLPVSLIVGLMRFGYNEYGPTKLTKHVIYPEILKMDMCLGFEAQYQLSAIVVHIGNSPASGHYICIARRFDGSWMKFDDDKVTMLGDEQHLGLQAYMLLYNKITSIVQ